MVSQRKKYCIGITIEVKADGTFSFFNNGLRQNVIFLYKLFAASANCEKVYLIHNNTPAKEPFPSELGLGEVLFVSAAEMPEDLDYLIVLGAGIEIKTLKRMRSEGKKIIFYKGGNGAIISIEATISKDVDKDAEKYGNYDCCDSIWMTPQHIHTYKGWCETIYRCPVHEVPQVWDPSFKLLQSEKVRTDYGYQPGKKDWRISIFDPNVTVMKTSHLPTMVCEYAFRLAPDKIKTVYITNSLQFQTNTHFVSFVSAMTAYKAGKMTVEARFHAWEFLTTHTDAVVTHHWENGLNYLYYEVLYGNYPLIHNSEFIKDYGYYYKDFDPEDGGRVLIEAFDKHDANLKQYAAKNAELFARLDPTSPENIELHEKLLFETKRNLAFD